MKTNFSAADLVKRSAMQIKYFREKSMDRPHTAKMDQGVERQKKVAKENLGSCEEMRSTLESGDIIIFACHDIVCGDRIIESKSTEYGKEDWYLESSLVQTAFYKSILMQSSGWLVTPKFRVKEGYERETNKVDPNIPYQLDFGGDVYDVVVNNPNAIINYFVEKAKATLGSYDDCRDYDAEHKFKHFEQLKDYFSFSLITGNS